MSTNLQLKTAVLCKYVWPWYDFLLPSGINVPRPDQKEKQNILQIQVSNQEIKMKAVINNNNKY